MSAKSTGVIDPLSQSVALFACCQVADVPHGGGGGGADHRHVQPAAGGHPRAPRAAARARARRAPLNAAGACARRATETHHCLVAK